MEAGTARGRSRRRSGGVRTTGRIGSGRSRSDEGAGAPSEGAKLGEVGVALPDSGYGEGRIEGRVTYGGAVPEPEILDMSVDPKCVHLAKTIEQRTSRSIEVDEEGGLANAVVWVELATEHAYPVPEEEIELHQEGCRFRPETIAIRTGQTLEVFNDDPTLHNVHGIVKRGEFNQAMPRQERGSPRLSKLPTSTAPSPGTSILG